MAELNKFQIIGNVGNAPELRSTGNGKPVTNYSVAISGGYYDNNDKWVDTTDWIPVTVYGKQAENDARHLAKGATVFVEGEIRPWRTEKDGVIKSGFNFIGLNVQYLRKPGNREEGDNNPGNREFAADYQAGAAAPVAPAAAAPKAGKKK